MECSRLEMEKERLKQDMIELKASHEQLKLQIASLDTELAPIKEQIEEHDKERAQFRLKNREGEELLMRSLHEMQREVDSFRSTAEECQRYEREESNRQSQRDGVTKAQQRLQSTRTQREALENEIQIQKNTLSEALKNDADIKANLEYRERNRAVEQHDKAIAKFKIKIN